ncbi:MAG: hypothetical protein ACR2PR_09030 [Pseudohongiellaceae bacterium]
MSNENNDPKKEINNALHDAFNGADNSVKAAVVVKDIRRAKSRFQHFNSGKPGWNEEMAISVINKLLEAETLVEELFLAAKHGEDSMKRSRAAL